MKYLTLLQDLDYRGSQRVAQNYSLGMSERGHDVRVLTLDALGPRTEILEKAGISCLCLKKNPHAMECILAWSPDVVHLHRPGYYDPSFNKIIEQLKSKLNCLVIETNIFSRVDYQIPQGVIDVHLHLTEWCLWKWSQWTKSLNYQPIGIVIPNSIVVEDFAPSSQSEIIANKERIGIPKKDFVFGRLGSKCEAKWHPVIVEAFKQAYQQNHQMSLLLVAPPSSIYEQVKALPSPIRDKVFIVPPIKGNDQALCTMYSTMDVMLHASKIGESFGMVLAEALLCETPILTLSTPAKDNSQVSLVDHNQAGKIVNNESAFIKAMLYFLKQPEKACSFGKKGRQNIIQRFENRVVCQQIDKLCTALLSLPNRHPSTIKMALKEEGFLDQEDIKNSKKIETLNQYDGKINYTDNLLSKIVHNPFIYRAYLYIRN